MEQKDKTQSGLELLQNNTINRYLTELNTSMLSGGLAYDTLLNGHQKCEAWIFRDDIGAPHGIKGYEEQVNSVGLHHGHAHWPHHITWNTFNSAT